MRILLCLLVSMAFSSCAHQKKCDESSPCQKEGSYKKAETETTFAYDGHCPMGLTKKLKVKGNPKYRVEYKGKNYLFSSPEARDSFLSKIDHHIKKADNHWESGDAVDRVR